MHPSHLALPCRPNIGVAAQAKPVSVPATHLTSRLPQSCAVRAIVLHCGTCAMLHVADGDGGVEYEGRTPIASAMPPEDRRRRCNSRPRKAPANRLTAEASIGSGGEERGGHHEYCSIGRGLSGP